MVNDTHVGNAALLFSSFAKTRVAQWVERWPTNLAVAFSNPAQGKSFSVIDGIPLNTAFHNGYIHSLSPAHRPDMTEILTKRT